MSCVLEFSSANYIRQRSQATDTSWFIWFRKNILCGRRVHTFFRIYLFPLPGPQIERSKGETPRGWFYWACCDLVRMDELLLSPSPGSRRVPQDASPSQCWPLLVYTQGIRRPLVDPPFNATKMAGFIVHLPESAFHQRRCTLYHLLL